MGNDRSSKQKYYSTQQISSNTMSSVLLKQPFSNCNKKIQANFLVQYCKQTDKQKQEVLQYQSLDDLRLMQSSVSDLIKHTKNTSQQSLYEKDNLTITKYIENRLDNIDTVKGNLKNKSFSLEKRLEGYLKLLPRDQDELVNKKETRFVNGKSTTTSTPNRDTIISLMRLFDQALSDNNISQDTRAIYQKELVRLCKKIFFSENSYTSLPPDHQQAFCIVYKRVDEPTQTEMLAKQTLTDITKLMETDLKDDKLIRHVKQQKENENKEKEEAIAKAMMRKPQNKKSDKPLFSHIDLKSLFTIKRR